MTTRVELAITEYLPRIVAEEKGQNRRDEYTGWTTGTPVVSVIIATFENMNPAITVTDFLIDTAGSPVQPHSVLIVPNGPRTVNQVSIGFNDAVREYLSTHPKWADDFFASPMTIASSFITLEVRASEARRSGAVGPPIAILEITRGGHRWFPAYQGVCSNQP